MDKIDVLLVHQPLQTPKGSFHNVHPIGFFSMADFLQRNGVSCRILNVAVEKSLSPHFSAAEYVKKVNPAVVGIGLHWYVHLFNAVKLAQELKRKTSVKLVFGGYTASVFSQDLLEKYPFVDAVINGEGELALLSFAKEIISGRNNLDEVPNLVFRGQDGNIKKSLKRHESSEQELNSFDYSNVELLKNYRQYFNLAALAPVSSYHPLPKQVPAVVQLSTGRGCSQNCFNCGASRQALGRTNFSIAVRYRSPQVVIKEIKTFIGLGYDCFAIVYNPQDDYDYYFKLFEAIRKEKIKIGLCFDGWFMPPRAFIDDFVKTFDLEKSSLGITLESGSRRIRRNIAKLNVSNDEILDLIKYASDKGLFTHTYFTVGLPKETKEDIKQTVKLVSQLKKNIGVVIVSAIPVEPGSPMAVYPEKFQVKIYRKTLQDYMEFLEDMAYTRYPRHPLGYATAEFSEQELQKIKLKVYLKCFMSRSYLVNFLRANKDKKRFKAKLFSWFGLVSGSPRIFYKYSPGAIC